MTESSSTAGEAEVCPICIDLYTDPVSLSCNHNLCLECAKLIRKVEAGNSSIICPMCEIETKLDREDMDLAKLMRNITLKTSADRRRASESLTDEALKFNAEQIKKITTVEVPKSMKLLEEYDASIGKDGKTMIPEIHTGMIGYGAVGDEPELSYWTAMIIGPQDSPIGQLIYNLEVTIPDEYPKVPPQVWFLNPKVLMQCVNEMGMVNVALIEKVNMDELNGEGMVEASTGEMFVWQPSKNIADVLVAIRENMHLRSVCVSCSSLGHAQYR